MKTRIFCFISFVTEANVFKINKTRYFFFFGNKNLNTSNSPLEQLIVACLVGLVFTLEAKALAFSFK